MSLIYQRRFHQLLTENYFRPLKAAVSSFNESVQSSIPALVLQNTSSMVMRGFRTRLTGLWF